MNIFIENYNKFLNNYKLKQNILAKKVNYDPNKLSRILTGKQRNISLEEMNDLSKAVGKTPEYFLSEITFNNAEYLPSAQIAFSSGTPTKESEEFANTLFDFIEHVDLILGMESKLNKSFKEDLSYEY